MTSLGIRYLTGNCVAADVAQESRPEWPPHPARVYMAMVASHFETGAVPAEREALLWLEQQGPPSIFASEEQPRSPVEVFVAVNDEAGIGMSRNRQPRSFPSCRPDQDTVWLTYTSKAPKEVYEALAALCRKVTRVGHSSSLVQMWMGDCAGERHTWLPSVKGKTRMRVIAPGVLELLERSFNGREIEAYWELQAKLEIVTGKEAKQVKDEIKARFQDGAPMASRPQLSNWAAYAKVEAELETVTPYQGPFDSNVLILECEREGPILGIETTLALTGSLRNALLKFHQEKCPAWVSGHDADGAVTRQPHLAFFPLPFVGGAYGDGHLLGVGIGVPRGTDTEEIRKYLGPFLYDGEGKARSIKLWKTGEPAWEWKVQLATESTAKTLRGETWTRPSKFWASVTPVVLHHYPDQGKPQDAERIVREAFRSAGLPEAEELRIRPVSVLQGGGHAKDMPKMEHGGSGLTRYQTHVMVRFAERVEGPVLLGRGRFRGYGLCRAVEEKVWNLWS